MCGIVGVISLASPAPDARDWRGLVDHLQHRGPDEGGFWARGPFFLGHRRLSIVGLDSGQQPMATSDGELAVTFNGEIFNHRELRKDLERRGHAFRTSSDTEVLLHGYREWGRSLPERLTGQFAFGIVDVARGELFLARDRFGEKPLLLLRTATALAFASELRPLAALPWFQRSIDEVALGSYLVLNYVAGARTLAEGVERLPPATWRLYGTGGKVTSARYWHPPTRERPEGPRPELALGELRERFDRAVALALSSDVPVAVLLSGGIDSALVAESAARQGGVRDAYVLDVPGPNFSERTAAEEVSRHLGLRLESIPLWPPTGDDLLAIASHADDPLADSSALAVKALARGVSARHKVALGGDGGDELFGGYLTYRATSLHARRLAALPLLLRRALGRAAAFVPSSERKVATSYKLSRFLRAAALPSGAAHFTWNGSWMPAEAAGLVTSPIARASVLEALGALTTRHGLSGGCTLFDLQRADVGDYLPNDILVKVDRMSMAHGLEVRAPFLEHELAGWALALPSSLKLGPGGESKRLLRAAARQVFGRAIANRPKQGFSVPIHAWLRGPFREIATDLLSPRSLAKCGVFDVAAIAGVLDAHMSGRRSLGFELWGLMVLVAWHRQRLETPPLTPVTANRLIDHSPVTSGS